MAPPINTCRIMLKQFYLNYFLHLDYREDTDLVSKVLSISHTLQPVLSAVSVIMLTCDGPQFLAQFSQ